MGGVLLLLGLFLLSTGIFFAWLLSAEDITERYEADLAAQHHNVLPPFQPPMFYEGSPAVRALAVELARRFHGVPYWVSTTPTSVVITADPQTSTFMFSNKVHHVQHGFQLVITETPSGFVREERVGGGAISGAPNSMQRSWFVARSVPLFDVERDWVVWRENGKRVRRTVQSFNLNEQVDQALAALGLPKAPVINRHMPLSGLLGLVAGSAVLIGLVAYATLKLAGVVE